MYSGPSTRPSSSSFTTSSYRTMSSTSTQPTGYVCDTIPPANSPRTLTRPTVRPVLCHHLCHPSPPANPPRQAH
ncbi:hypothetical protein BDW22DRAFT_1364663 [Trametopsis cervina]|nr:hypothetical protein BDW22DRAFT_1364663 [Trametopsis cervina]